MAKSSNEGSGGKLLDTWFYEYSGIAAEPEDEDPDDDDTPPPTKRHVQPLKVAIELRLIKTFIGDTPPLALKDVKFAITCKQANISLQGTDIEALRAAMWDQLDKKYAVKWEDYYLVQMEPHAPYAGMGTGLIFSYQHIEKGTAWDGTLLLRKRGWRHDVIIEPWPGEFLDKRGKVLACIPETITNSASLKHFSSRIDDLREHLADRLRPETIIKTLASASGMVMIAGAAQPEADILKEGKAKKPKKK